MMDIVDVKGLCKENKWQSYAKNGIIYLQNEIGEVVQIGICDPGVNGKGTQEYAYCLSKVVAWKKKFEMLADDYRQLVDEYNELLEGYVDLSKERHEGHCVKYIFSNSDIKCSNDCDKHVEECYSHRFEERKKTCDKLDGVNVDSSEEQK